jgi:flavin reductase (DIM6/NTAB) family NADH-FMN oxidoreductase RutF
MKSFDPTELDWADQYKLVAGSIVPRPIALVTTLGPDGLNAAPFSAFNIVSFSPPMVMISVGPPTSDRHGDDKDTIRNLRALPECVIHIVTYDMRDSMNLCAVEHSRDVDEIALAGLKSEASTRVRPPRLSDFPVQFECRIDRIIELGSIPYYLVIAEVVMLHFRDDIVNKRLHVDNHALDPIGRMASAGGYARPRDASFTLHLPDLAPRQAPSR